MSANVSNARVGKKAACCEKNGEESPLAKIPARELADEEFAAPPLKNPSPKKSRQLRRI